MFNILKNMASLQKELAELNSKIEYQLTPSWSNQHIKSTEENGVVYINYYCGEVVDKRQQHIKLRLFRPVLHRQIQ